MRRCGPEHWRTPFHSQNASASFLSRWRLQCPCSCKGETLLGVVKKDTVLEQSNMGSRRRRNRIKRSCKKQRTTLGDKILSCLCGVEPRVIEDNNDLPLCSKEEFRAMHDRKLRKGKQVGFGTLKVRYFQDRRTRNSDRLSLG